VVGLGAMGSAAVYHLARRGVRVLGLDQFHPPHTLGSTHGQSRIIREAYFERPHYVPLVRRAYQLWDELGAESGTLVYRKTGGLMLGPPDGTVVPGSRESAQQHGIPHQMVTPEEVRKRFPGFTPPDHFIGLWEHRAGLLFPEEAVSAHLTLAERHGGVIKRGVAMRDWSREPAGIRLRTDEGEVGAARLVLSLGPWVSRFSGELGPLFTVERQLFHWFTPTTDAGGWPIALWEHRPGGLFATLPDQPNRVKAGIHHEGDTVDPDRVNRVPTPEDERKIRQLLAQYLPAANGGLLDSTICLYTNTPDRHFVVDWFPGTANVLVVSPCSGHGFKFSSALGEAVAQLVTGGSSSLDLTSFRLSRFQ
jgi:sarcosine oxidase